MPVSPRGHRKQIVLFLLAVILPSLVLVVFALRMISQERELAQKRMLDERRRLASEIGQHLLVRLEKIKLQESSAAANWAQLSAQRYYVNPEVVLIGLVQEDRLLLPWEENKKSEQFRRLLSSSDFSRKIQLAESEEFAKKDFIRATGLYRQLMESAQEPVQRGYARLLLARALAKAGRKKEALSHYRRILDLPSSVTDEYGIPLSLYAAGPLLDAGVGYGEVLECIRVELRAKRWLSPSESYMLQEIIERLINTASEESLKDTAKDYQRLINEHILELEQALELQGDFQKIAFTAKQENQGRRDEPIWISYGEIPWLVSLGPSLAGSQPLLFVVHAQDILASLRRDSGFSETFPGEFHLVTGESSEGESLGPNFRGLKIAFAESEDTALSKQWSFQRSFYLLALLLVLSVTLFGAYLLWRDVRRDVRMAEMRSQFVSSVSHELKTPLTAIRMFAETLRLGRSRNLKTQAEYLDTIVSESQRLTRLLNNVLDFSKIEQGKRIYKPELTSLSEIIQASARAMKYPLSQQGFELNVRAEEGLPDVRVDKDALEQAILNLLNNAMKYSGESREIDLRLQRKDDQALIQVTDRGVGIDPREQKRIFEKFYRVPMAENERIVGTGLGLTLVSHIVKAHGGNIEVESAPGKGSTFSIYLPLESKQ
jgi:signal transduction histidine kinase/tetratricopeptide (TPR) repeat protein